MRHTLSGAVVVGLLSLPALAQDARTLAKLPEPAVETLRAEMRDNLVTLNEITTLVVTGKVKEAGEVAERKLGTGAMGQHRDKPLEARPGPHMPPAMHELGRNQHKVASAFAAIAATGDREKTLAALPTLSGACVSCHLAYRLR
ncbi:MAG: cytochrome C [Myxococcota bacterium]